MSELSELQERITRLQGENERLTREVERLNGAHDPMIRPYFEKAYKAESKLAALSSALRTIEQEMRKNQSTVCDAYDHDVHMGICGRCHWSGTHHNIKQWADALQRLSAGDAAERPGTNSK